MLEVEELQPQVVVARSLVLVPAGVALPVVQEQEEAALPGVQEQEEAALPEVQEQAVMASLVPVVEA
jgi:hypothetical protein